jgi:hypothetical protein
MRSPHRLPALLLALATTPVCVTAEVPTYTTFQLQARAAFTGGFNLPTGSSFNSVTPAINDDGTVAFKLIVVGSTGNGGVWTGSDGSGSVVYDAPAERILGDVSINEPGEVDFHRSLDCVSEGVWRYDPVTTNTTLAVPVGGPFGILGFSDPVIDDAGRIGARVDRGSTQAYVVDDGGAQTLYVEEGTSGIAFLFTGELDEMGRMAGKVRLGGLGNDQPDEIRRYEPDGSFTTMAVDQDSDVTSPFTGFGNGIGVSDGGLVAFVGDLPGGNGVFLSDGTTITTIATFEDPEISAIDFFWPQVNDDGLVVFRAFEPGGTRAIFAGDGTTLRRVIGEHDVVPTDLGDARIDRPDASPVFGGNPGVNAGGDVVFSVSLTAVDDPQVSYGNGIFVAVAGSTVDVDPEQVAPPVGLSAAPTPFVRSVAIFYDLALPGNVSLGVFAADGRRVRELGAGRAGSGRHDVEWDGTDGAGRSVPPGVYFVRLSSSTGEERTLRVVRAP